MKVLCNTFRSISKGIGTGRQAGSAVEDAMQIVWSLGALVRALPAQGMQTLEALLDRIHALFDSDREKRRQVAFSVAMIALSAKMAKADGVVSQAEIAAFQQIFSILGEINAQGTTILLVEQNAQQALSLAHRGYVLETGRIVKTGPGRDLLTDPAVREAYLGVV